MLNSIALAAFAVLAVAGGVAAQTCTTYPNTLTNGTTADANQVMANFNCAALLGGANYTGPITFSTAVANPAITINNGGAAGMLFQHTGGPNSQIFNDGNFHVEANGTLWINQQGNGNVYMVTGGGTLGVGTSNPNSKLDVRGNIYFGVAPDGQPYNQQALLSDGPGASMRLLSGTGIYLMVGSTPTKLALSENTACEAASMVCLTSSGYLGIGSTSPSYPLYVNGTAYASGAAGALSDARHKDNIELLAPGALTIVQKLKPVTFVWKDPKDDGMRGEQIGFIAQDVQKILPDVVLTEKNAEKTLGIKYTEIIPVLTAAIQEQQAEIIELRGEIAALKGK